MRSMTADDAPSRQAPVSGVTSDVGSRSPGSTHQHLVQFYESDASLSEVVSNFLIDGLASKSACVAILTPAHRVQFSERLMEKGIDVAQSCAGGLLRFVDAHELLEKFMVGSMPDWNLFEPLVGSMLQNAAEASSGPVRAYGEMVDVLWSAGNHAAAIRLEEMWNDLQRVHAFSLLCAYVVANFYKHPAGLESVCSSHTRVLPTIDETQPPPTTASPSLFDDGAPELFGELRLMEAEVRQRQVVEAALRHCLRDLNTTKTELQKSERQLSSVTDALPLLIAYVDREHRHRFVNLAYQRWFDRPASDLLGRHVEEVLGSELYAELREHMDAALSGQTRRLQTRSPHANEAARSLDITCIPHNNGAGQVEGIVALVADVSDRVRLETQRQETTRRTERLMKITAALAEAVAPQQVFEAVVDQVATTLNASSAGLFHYHQEDETVRLLHSVGYPESTVNALSCLPLNGPHRVPALDAIRAGKPLWFDSQRDLLEQYPNLHPFVSPERSYQIACLPLIVQQRMLGSIGFTFDDTPAIDPEQRDFLMLVTRYCGQALERLRLLEAERQSRASAEVAAARANILSRASRAFSEAGSDLTSVIQATVEQITMSYAEGCMLALVSGDALEIEALHHRDPEASQMMREALRHAPPQLFGSTVGQVALTGKPLFLPVADPDRMAQARPEYRAWLERFTPRSVIVVPLRTGGKIIGTLAVFREQGSLAFAPEDVTFLEELSSRAALAIESSHLHRENLNERLRTELLYGLARAVIEAERVEQVFEAALDALEKALGAPRSSILTYDLDDVMRFNAWRGLSEDYRRAVEGHSPWLRNARNPEPILVRDAQHDPNMAAYHELFAREGIGALGFIPLLAGGKLVGKFMVYYDSPRELTSHELDMAKAIANHVAAAVVRFSVVAELQRTVRFNEMFAGILGHDLRNPLNAIMTSAQLTMHRSTEERLVKPMQRIISSGERMARMIDQLLDFTRVRVGAGIPIDSRPVDLVQLLRQVMDELEGANPNCKLEFEHVGDTTGAWDLDRLSQVFSNLVGNAMQHGEPDHGVTVRVDGTQGSVVRVEVCNQGTIPDHVLPKAFEPMAGGEQRRQKSKGLGLGLYITQQIIKAHGGSIEVRSNAANGTTFTAWLPRFHAQAHAD